MQLRRTNPVNEQATRSLTIGIDLLFRQRAARYDVTQPTASSQARARRRQLPPHGIRSGAEDNQIPNTTKTPGLKTAAAGIGAPRATFDFRGEADELQGADTVCSPTTGPDAKRTRQSCERRKKEVSASESVSSWRHAEVVVKLRRFNNGYLMNSGRKNRATSEQACAARNRLAKLPAQH